jgi:hypothetical protein
MYIHTHTQPSMASKQAYMLLLPLMPGTGLS